MNRRELVQAIAANTDVDTKTVDAVLSGFTDVVSATMKKEPVVISGFAKFQVRKSKARMGRNPQTGEAIKIKASTKAKVTPLKGLKDIALGVAPAPSIKAAPKKAAAKKAPAKKTAAKKAPAKKTAARRR